MSTEPKPATATGDQLKKLSDEVHTRVQETVAKVKQTCQPKPATGELETYCFTPEDTGTPTFFVKESDHNAAIAAEREKYRISLAVNKDDCETDTNVRNLARPILGDFKVDGDSYGVPGLEDITEELIKQLAAERETSVQLRELLDSEMKRMEKALTAERQESNKRDQIVSTQLDQLTAERKLRDEIEHEYPAFIRLQEQLADERKKQDSMLLTMKLRGDENKQLRAQLAAIELELQRSNAKVAEKASQLAAARIELAKVLTGEQLDAALAKVP